MIYYKFDRNKVLSEMLTELEDKVGPECPGQDLAFCWYLYLYHSPSVLAWLFNTETVRPTGFPPWFRTYKYEDDLKKPEAEWRKNRKDDWERKYWTEDRSSPLDERKFVQFVGDPDLPDEYQSKWLFGEVLTAIPVEAFQWAQRYIALREKSETIYHSYRDAEWELTKPAFYFMFIETRAKRWRGRRGVKDISKIFLPNWAKYVNKIKHDLEDGKLPPFDVEESSYPRGRRFL